MVNRVVPLMKQGTTFVVLVVDREVGERQIHSMIPLTFLLTEQLVNVDNELLDKCARRIAQQRTFDNKPLGVAVCYGCCCGIVWMVPTPFL